MKRGFTKIRMILLGGVFTFSLGVPSFVHASSFEKSGIASVSEISSEKTVNGTVVSVEDGTPIPGVSVMIKNTSTGTITDVDGKYTLNVNDENAILVFSSVGFMTQEVTVGNKSNVSIKLAIDQKTLGEVVVVGYGTQKKSQLTGAISSVGAKEIGELPVTNARQALQGRAAGVDVNQAGSKPGSAPQIRIRGRRSFNASNDPLYVVDGIPLAGGIDDINPNDIASMEVLKDASSTAIYGSRGANGVVIISTKRGKVGETIVSVDTYAGVSKSLGRIDVMNGAEFAEYKRESRRTGGHYPAGPATDAADAAIFEPVELESIRLGRSTDYPAALLRTGVIQSHQVAVSGGSEKTIFNISANFFKDKGVVKNQDFNRNTFRINLDHKINNRVRIGTSTLGVYSIRNGEEFNPLGGALAENPLGKPYDDEGNLIFLPTQDGLRTNPLAEIVPGAVINERKTYRIFNSLYAEVDILKGLKYRFNFGPDFEIDRYGRFFGSQTNARRGAPAAGNTENKFHFNYTVENILTYSKQFNSTHNLNVTLLQSYQKDTEERAGIGVNGIPAESQQFYNLGSASQVTGVGTSLEEWALLSYMARINYDFKEKYLLTATLRADGSSVFGANNKFGYFPSLALGWNISSEDFLRDVRFLDMLKLRLSYGSTGNQAIDPYQTQPLLGRTSYAWDNSAAFGYRPGTIGNPDLRWETSSTANAGLDFSFLNGRISGAIEYYITRTSDLLAPQPLPNSTGFGGFTTNIGETENRGIELSLSTINVDKGDFRWSTDIMFTKNNERIISLANGKVDDVAAGRFIGEPLSVIFDYRKIGIWQSDEEDLATQYQSKVGEIKIEDVNNDGIINADDRQILGSAVPNFVAGVTNRLSFKGIDLSFFLYARAGQQIISSFHQGNNSLAGRYNNLDIDYWTPDNPTNEFPRPNENQESPRYSSTLRYFDGSFLKIRNINIGYNVPVSLAEKLKMKSLRVFSSIQQPKIWSKYRSQYKGIDPEVELDNGASNTTQGIGSDLSPATTVITFGLNAKF
ncbi:TonB-linked SusC/RagA family outer membrane protein [Dyadobacter jejuensis]|uniref:TonB-linked SusC/RagA family outer membrane protein n=1 Tax=Dyadobacter jejuensis TaxID=1082580 RepID=A0A316AKN8_9BACT|nr:TonB-dependent receptor [Dyadobacter jejuensis]PWJ58333.1 TonB-linked SusC/RagA family outer membrane protein [Dyadobacter jejuensis]